MSRSRIFAKLDTRRMRVVLLAGLLGTQGCAIPPSFAGTTRMGSPVTLSRLYVYSFLDLRERDLGPSMIREIGDQLAARLQSRGVATEQHAFKDDRIAAQFARRGGSELVPVGYVIHGNQASERRFGADYRLVAFPTETTTGGGWLYYNFLWSIEDTRTGNVVWSTTSRASHLVVVSANENPEGRARVIVNGLIRQMAAAGLIPLHPLQN